MAIKTDASYVEDHFGRWLGKWLRRSRVIHECIQLPTDTAALPGYLFAGLFREFYYELNKLKRPEQGIIVLIVNDYVVVRRKQLLTYMRGRLAVQLPTFLSKKVELKQIIGEHGKNDLIGDHRKGARSKLSQINKTLELTVSLFGGNPKMIFLPLFSWIFDILGVNQ